jgi:phage baseplate assembly protein W
MAYQISNKNPIDVGSKVAIGVSIPFNSPQVFTQTYATQDQIKSNIINYVLTNKGEKIFDPTFGSNIRNSLFETITPSLLRNIETTLNEELSSYFFNVNFTSITVTADYDENTIYVQIVYSLYNGPTNEINIVL